MGNITVVGGEVSGVITLGQGKMSLADTLRSVRRRWQASFPTDGR